MAIMGFLVHSVPELCGQLECDIGNMPEMTTYGIHQECYIVTVAEAPQTDMEMVLNRVKRLDGVIAVYVTSLTVEDEQEPDIPEK